MNKPQLRIAPVDARQDPMVNQRRFRRLICPPFWILLLWVVVSAVSAETYRSHSPTRALPKASQRPRESGPSLFVDPLRGDDSQLGSERAPWKTLGHAIHKLQPGSTLYLRGGTYYEKVSLLRSGNEQSPITIRSYPGEVAVIDGGLREFFEAPAGSWIPNPDGAEGEYVSTKTYFDADQRRVPHQFIAGAWEPMWGIEAERPLALGHFGDSMLPLHGYRLAVDLRSSNEYWIGGKAEMRETGIYCGPGLWFNRDTGRIHIRLAPHRMAGLAESAYRGETDPRRLPLIVAAGFGEDVLRISGVKHVRIQDLVLRGATGSPMIDLYGSEDIALDHITVYGGFPALLVNASQNIRVTDSAFRGLAAPWTSRAHMKYRGTASYQIVLQNNQPMNEDIEFAGCEFTDDHDFAFLRFAKNLRFHHNYVDNFNDDGLECGPKLRDHTLYIYQNRIGRCLIPITQHEINKDESPLDQDPGSGVYFYRNVFDMRGGTYKSPPEKADASGNYLREEGHVASDHGGPIWPVIRLYHNTLLRDTPVFRDNYLFGLAVQGLRNTQRDVMNNIFVQADRVPGIQFIAMKQAESLREGGNVLWGVNEGPLLKRDPFAKFRATPLFEQSKQHYAPGWTTQDQVVDPKFVNLPLDWTKPSDLRLQPGSAAIDSGVPIPAEWPDPVRDADSQSPDAGAFPHGYQPWTVGVDGRMSGS